MCIVPAIVRELQDETASLSRYKGYFLFVWDAINLQPRERGHQEATTQRKIETLLKLTSSNNTTQLVDIKGFVIFYKLIPLKLNLEWEIFTTLQSYYLSCKLYMSEMNVKKENKWSSSKIELKASVWIYNKKRHIDKKVNCNYMQWKKNLCSVEKRK